jgi:Leucine-rich repeat (LRR) protein
MIKQHGFEIERGKYGQRLVLTGPWSSDIAAYMHRERIGELYLNHARGWSGDSIEFVGALPDLIAFGILDFTIQDVSPIHRLTNLRALEISTYCKTPIDFTCFGHLEDCVFYWRGGSESLFEHRLLTRLFIHRYDALASAPLARLKELTVLSIANSDLTEVRHLAPMMKLRFLGLYNLKKLKSLSGIEGLSGLEELEVNGCKGISAIDEIANLPNLRRLQLNEGGKIASLRPVQGAKNLEEVLFYDSTHIVDGDLSPLASLPQLKRISFRNRRHYSHTRESFATVS